MEIIKTLARTVDGTPFAKVVRKEGNVPAVLYASKQNDEKFFSINEKLLSGLIQDDTFLSKIFTLSIEEKEYSAIAKKVQLHPVTDRPLHAEFMPVHEGSKVTVFVPIHFFNEEKSPGIKLGGVLNILIHSLEVLCAPSLIPHELKVDLSGKIIGNTIHLSDLKIPANVIPVHPERDNVIATIVSSSVSSKNESEKEEEVK